MWFGAPGLQFGAKSEHRVAHRHYMNFWLKIDRVTSAFNATIAFENKIVDKRSLGKVVVMSD